MYPVGPVEYLSGQDFHGNFYVMFDYGAYVLWKMYPAVKVSIDSRYEAAYPDWLVTENVQFYSAMEGWQDILTKYPTDIVLIPKALPIASVMPRAQGWKRVYTDRAFEIYERPGLNLPVVDWSDRTLEGRFP
jgi:hypothetical protein